MTLPHLYSLHSLKKLNLSILVFPWWCFPQSHVTSKSFILLNTVSVSQWSHLIDLLLSLKNLPINLPQPVQRTLIMNSVDEVLRTHHIFGDHVLNSRIRYNIKVSEAPFANLPIRYYAATSNAAQDYAGIYACGEHVRPDFFVGNVRRSRNPLPLGMGSVKAKNQRTCG